MIISGDDRSFQEIVINPTQTAKRAPVPTKKTVINNQDLIPWNEQGNHRTGKLSHRTLQVRLYQSKQGILVFRTSK